MRISRFPIRRKTSPRALELKEAIVASFTLDPAPASRRLAGFSEADWHCVLWWLDIGGMAIYFYHRACEIGADGLLPWGVKKGLEQRLNNNRIRMASMLAEARALAEEFDRSNVPFALLKGITLTPYAVAESALRCQTDLDFLIDEGSENCAIHLVARLGYRLHAKSGNALEFCAGPADIPDLANLYSVKTQRKLELHLARKGSCECQLLSRRVLREFDGARIYALSPADILVVQASHLLKHLCDEHTRLSWVLEFWRHVKNRHEDNDFWHRVQSSAAEFGNGDLAIGVAVWVAERMFGSTQVEVLSRWRADALPVRVRLWLERYARSLLLSDRIGNKLYALLRREVPGNAYQTRTIREILLPRVLPAAILERQPHEKLRERLARYGVEAEFVLRRLWFHLREGIRFAIEASRWNRVAARAER